MMPNIPETSSAGETTLIVALLLEWALLVITLRGIKKSLPGLSFVMNTSSYLIGVLIFGW